MRLCRPLSCVVGCLVWQFGGLVGAGAEVPPQEGPRIIGPNPVYEPLPEGKVTPLELDSFADLVRESEVPAHFPAIPEWQGRDRCGLNCLFAVLAFTDNFVSYSKLCERAGSVPDAGYSFEQLRRLASEFGLKAEVVRGDVSKLDELDAPVILHIGTRGQPGHFICLYRPPNRNLLVLDGTSGGVNVLAQKHSNFRRTLYRQASGYMLLPIKSEGPLFLNRILATFSTTVWVGAAIVWLIYGVRIWRIRG